MNYTPEELDELSRKIKLLNLEKPTHDDVIAAIDLERVKLRMRSRKPTDGRNTK